MAHPVHPSEREREREREKEREKERERERERKSRMCGHDLIIPHSFSQSVSKRDYFDYNLIVFKSSQM